MKLFTILSALVISATAQAKIAQCLLVVDGKTYLNGDCNYDAHNDGNGSFSIGTGNDPARHFAYVLINGDAEAVGYWNGVEGGSHAHSDLGPLKRNGACRFNDRAIVCAWAK